MDPLTALLDVPRAREAFLLRVTMSPPWSVRVRDEAPLAVVAVTSGSACFAPRAGDVLRLGPGDLLLLARPDPYLFASAPGVAPQAVILPGGRCESPTGESLELPMRRGVRSWGNDADGSDSMVVGTYPHAGEVGSRLLRALPPAVVLRAGDAHQGLVDVLVDELAHEAVGQSCLLDRLLDALTLAAIRQWCAAPGVEPPGWLGAGDDPVVRSALDLMHDDVANRWSVASLAQQVGMSRAGFSRRFTAAVGEPPMTYLTSWRMALAADLLRGTADPVQRVAAAVGYASPFTFSTAFKRHVGTSPLSYRRRTAEAVPLPTPVGSAG